MMRYLQKFDKQRIFLLLTIGVMLAYFFNVNRLTDNIPFADDYGHMLDFLNVYVDKGVDYSSKLRRLWRPHSIHRTVLVRLTVLMDYNVFGSINFKHIILIGNFNLLLIFLLLSYKLKLNKLGYQHMLVFSLFLFVPVNTLSNWALSTFGYFTLMLIAIISFLMLDRGGWFNFFVSLFFAVLSTLTTGAGLFVFLCAYSILIVKKEYNWRHILVWTIVFFSWSYFFLQGIHRPPSYPPVGSMLFNEPLTVIGYYLASLGSFFKDIYIHHQWLKFVIGLLMTSYLLFLVIKYFSFFKNNTFLSCLLIFIIMIVAGGAMNRSHFGIAYGERDKFHFLPALYLGLTYVCTLKIFKNYQKLILWPVLFFTSILFTMKMDTQLKLMLDHQYLLNNRIASYLMHRTDPDPKFSLPLRRSGSIETAITKGTYTPVSSYIMSPIICDLDSSSFVEESLNYSISVVDKNGIIEVKGWAFRKKYSMKESRIFIKLSNENQSEYFISQNLIRRDLTQRFWKENRKNIDDAGFKNILTKEKLSLNNGEYMVSIIVELKLNNGKRVKYITDTKKSIIL